MNKFLIIIGGIIHVLIGALHVTLGQAMDWAETLKSLPLDNRATIYTLNVHVAFTCLIFAYLSLFYRKELLSSGIGRSITAMIALFWILRAANQVIFNGLSAPDTPFWVIFCLAVGLLYLIPTISRRFVQPVPVI